MSPVANGNPYQALLEEALSERGAETVKEPRPRLSHALRASRSRDTIHLHWPEIIVGSNARGRLDDIRSAHRSLHLLLVLGVARLRRVRIVWTVHNLIPHEARRPRLDLALNRCLARLADTVLAHSRHAAALASRTYRRRDVEVAYHGNYLGYYPAPQRSRAETRRELGLPEDAHVILAFGFVRPYKRLPELIAAFGEVADPSFRLLIAGPPFNDSVKREVEAVASGDPRVVLRLERIPDTMVRALHEAADVGAFAYQDVFSSGALLLALSCGLPAIAPADSTATELGSPPAVQPYRPDGLAAALAASAGTTAADRESALATAERYGWDAMARLVLGEPASAPLDGAQGAAR
jgi:beta-1,4-mannosyltransferase